MRKAFKVAQAQKPGPTHIELPEDVMADQVDAVPLPAPTHGPQPRAVGAGAAQGGRRSSARRSTRSCWPATASPASAPRPALREFARATGIGVAETFMGKGLLDYEDPRALGTVGLQSRDYALAGFEDADVVITVGYDLVEHSPENWNPKKDKKIVCIDTTAAEVDEHFQTEVDLVGDLYHILTRLAEELRDAPHDAGHSRLNDIILGRFESAKDDDAFPMQPPRALWEIRDALRREDLLISDVGLHKLWIARMFPAHEPNTVFIANGLAGMGIALPTAIAAKLVHPERNVITVNGDGGFLMNCQELETAVRLQDPDRQRDLGELAVRLDRLEAGQEVRPPLRHRLHQPRLRQAGRRLRDAGLALRADRGLRPPPAPRADPRPAVADRAADRLLDRRGDLGRTRNGDCCRMSITADQEKSVLTNVNTQLFIGGEWREASGGATLDVEDPSTGETIAEVADATPEDAAAALDAACAAQAEWAAHPPRERGEILRRAYEAITAQGRRARAA